jgi:phospho-N-acetylmuramoyl-pentapeptide-transferase
VAAWARDGARPPRPCPRGPGPRPCAGARGRGGPAGRPTGRGGDADGGSAAGGQAAGRRPARAVRPSFDPAPFGAALAAFVLAWLALGWAPALLRRLGLQQVVRRQGPASHWVKEGTPTAGGLLFVPAALLAAWAAYPRAATLLVALAVTAGHGALGFLDDYLKVVRRRPEGLKARYKLTGQLLLAGLLGVGALALRPEAQLLAVPFLGARWLVGPGTFLALTALALLGATNGANFTDGADGLLASTGAAALAALGAIAWHAGDPSLAALAWALVGAQLAFLRWNWHPARVFMGDTGSMAIGAAFASVGVLTATTLYLPVVGLLFLLEVLSVVVQVASFRLTGRRLLRMAPLHHHLELGGWSEGRLVPRLLAFGLACAALGLAAVRW